MADIDEDALESFGSSHLLFIDEKEARENKHDSVAYEFNLDLEIGRQSSLLEILDSLHSASESTEEIKCPQLDEDLSTDIDEDFFCKACSEVVRDPVMCEGCQYLLCSECAQSSSQCVSGCPELKVVQIPRIVRKQYSELKVRCRNTQVGCPVSGKIDDVYTHERSCGFKAQICQNPTCSKPFKNSDRAQKHSEIVACSVVCGNIAMFYKNCQGSPDEVVKGFALYLSEAKKDIEAQVMWQLQDKIRFIDQKKKEIAKEQEVKDRLLAEIQTRKENHHIGKWSTEENMWTCCNNEEKYSIGCKNL